MAGEMREASWGILAENTTWLAFGLGLGLGLGLGSGLGSGLGFGLGSGLGFALGSGLGFASGPRVRLGAQGSSQGLGFVTESQTPASS